MELPLPQGPPSPPGQEPPPASDGDDLGVRHKASMSPEAQAERKKQVKKKAEDGIEVAWENANKRAAYDQQLREKRRAKREAKLIMKEVAGGDASVEILAKRYTQQLREKRAAMVKEGTLKPPPEEKRDGVDEEEEEESPEERKSRELLETFVEKDGSRSDHRFRGESLRRERQPAVPAAAAGGVRREPPTGVERKPAAEPAAEEAPRKARRNLGAMGLLKKKPKKKAGAMGVMGILQKTRKKEAGGVMVPEGLAAVRELAATATAHAEL